MANNSFKYNGAILPSYSSSLRMDSSGAVLVSVTNSDPNAIPVTIAEGPVDETGLCSVCKKEGTICYRYSLIKVSRLICNCCYIKAMDKLFGVQSNVDLENTLYGK